MSLYVVLANGDILFHKKNETPPNWKSDNYFQDDLDKWLYHPNFVECPARRRVNKITKCNKTFANWTCDLKKTNEWDAYGETITAAICRDCTINPLLQQLEVRKNESV